MNSQRLRYYNLLLQRKAELDAAGVENENHQFFDNHANGALTGAYDKEFNVSEQPISTNLESRVLRSSENNQWMETEETVLLTDVNGLDISRSSSNDEENSSTRGAGYTVTQVFNYDDIIDIGDSDDDEEFNPEEFFVPHIPPVDRKLSPMPKTQETMDKEHVMTEKEDDIGQEVPSVEMELDEVDESVDVFVSAATITYFKDDSNPSTPLPSSSGSSTGTPSPATLSDTQRTQKRKISQSCRVLLEAEKKRLRDLNYLSTSIQAGGNVPAIINGKSHLENEQPNKLPNKPELRADFTLKTSGIIPRSDEVSVLSSASKTSSSTSSSSASSAYSQAGKDEILVERTPPLLSESRKRLEVERVRSSALKSKTEKSVSPDASATNNRKELIGSTIIGLATTQDAPLGVIPQAASTSSPTTTSSGSTAQKEKRNEVSAREKSVVEKSKDIVSGRSSSIQEFEKNRPTASSSQDKSISSVNERSGLSDKNSQRVVTETSNVTTVLTSKDTLTDMSRINSSAAIQVPNTNSSKSEVSDKPSLPPLPKSKIDKSSLPPLPKSKIDSPPVPPKPKSKFNPNFQSKGVLDADPEPPRGEERRVSADQTPIQNSSPIISPNPVTQSSSCINVQRQNFGSSSVVRAEKDKPLSHEIYPRSVSDKDLVSGVRKVSEERESERSFSSTSSTAEPRHQTKTLSLPKDRSINIFSSEKHQSHPSGREINNRNLSKSPDYVTKIDPSLDPNPVAPKPSLWHQDREEFERFQKEKEIEKDNKLKELLGESDEESELPESPVANATTTVTEKQPIRKSPSREDSIRINSSSFSLSSSSLQNSTYSSAVGDSSSSLNSSISVSSVVPVPVNISFGNTQVDISRPEVKLDYENMKKLTLTNEEIKIIHYLPNSFFNK
jgi:hypothetical protein